MKDYELVVLYHPDLEIDLDKALKKIDGLIKDCGGKVLFSDSWGKRRLAYKIAKQQYAIYVYYEINIDLPGVAKLESLLNITDEVMRYLISKPTPNFGDRDKSTRVEDEDVDESDEKEDKNSKDKKQIKEVKDEESKED